MVAFKNGNVLVDFIDPTEVGEYSEAVKAWTGDAEGEFSFLNGVLWNSVLVAVLDPPVGDASGRGITGKLQFKRFPEGNAFLWGHLLDDIKLVSKPLVPKNALLASVDPPMWVQFCRSGLILTGAYLWCNDVIEEIDSPGYAVSRVDDGWLIRVASNDLSLGWLKGGGLFLFMDGFLARVFSRSDLKWVTDNRVLVTPNVVITKHLTAEGVLYQQTHYNGLGAPKYTQFIQERELKPMKIEDVESERFLYVPAWYLKQFQGVLQ